PTSAAATSSTATGQRTSSVNRTPAASPRASASANRSYFDSGRTPPDTRSEVRTIAASGATAATATSAAAFAAPYGNTGDGSSASVYGSGRPLWTASDETCTSLAPCAAAARATTAAPTAFTAQLRPGEPDAELPSTPTVCTTADGRASSNTAATEAGDVTSNGPCPTATTRQPAAAARSATTPPRYPPAPVTSSLPVSSSAPPGRPC